ncbi:MAG: hypothetical protein KIS61_24130 [Candidatus Eremiobacteraeota bacterium]|nr:hypothetical protein [Candidatus Eremiobacteraeota bacterium]
MSQQGTAPESASPRKVEYDKTRASLAAILARPRIEIPKKLLMSFQYMLVSQRPGGFCEVSKNLI